MSETNHTAADGPASAAALRRWREPERPRIRPLRLAVAWVLSAAALLFAAWVVPGVQVEGFGGALVAALLIALLNAVLPPVLAALRLPFTLVLGLLLVLVLDALMFMIVAEIAPGALSVDSFWWALAARAPGLARLGGAGHDLPLRRRRDLPDPGDAAHRATLGRAGSQR